MTLLFRMYVREGEVISAANFKSKCDSVVCVWGGGFLDSRLPMPATNCEQLQPGALDFHSLLIIAAEPEPAGPTVDNGEPTKNRRRTDGKPLENPCTMQICAYKMLILYSYHITLQLQIYGQACPNIFNIQATWLILPVLIPPRQPTPVGRQL